MLLHVTTHVQHTIFFSRQRSGTAQAADEIINGFQSGTLLNSIWIQIQIYVVWKKDVLVASRTDVIFYASANCEGGMKLKSNVEG